jgi:hypothetical protein
MRREAAPIMSELKAQFIELSDEVSAKSALGKAVTYTLNHWNGLAAFLEDGRIEVDSNVVERSMKSVALTRKNSLFVAVRAAERLSLCSHHWSTQQSLTAWILKSGLPMCWNASSPAK